MKWATQVVYLLKPLLQWRSKYVSEKTPLKFIEKINEYLSSVAYKWIFIDSIHVDAFSRHHTPLSKTRWIRLRHKLCNGDWESMCGESLLKHFPLCGNVKRIHSFNANQRKLNFGVVRFFEVTYGFLIIPQTDVYIPAGNFN